MPYSLDELAKEKQITYNKEKDLYIIAYYILNVFIKKELYCEKSVINICLYTS